MILKPLHKETGDFFLDFILLPYGYFLNKEYVNVPQGQEMMFYDGRVVRLHASALLNIADRSTDLLCKMRYGMSIRAILDVWKCNAAALGNGRDAVSDEQCIMVTYYAEEGLHA